MAGTAIHIVNAIAATLGMTFMCGYSLWWTALV
jgi:hypothetical protein